MNIHEYQAKELLKGYGVAVLDGHVAWTPDEAAAAAGEAARPGLRGEVADPCRRARGRALRRRPDRQGRRAPGPLDRRGAGRGRGDDRPHAGDEADRAARARRCSRVYVEAGCDIARELYLSLLVDRVTGRVTLVASAEGGMEIEEVAADHPEKILRVGVDPATGISGFHARRLAYGLGLSGKQVAAFGRFIPALYAAFTELDCTIVEINPLVVTGAGEVIALDAKISFDDNALFRHPELEKLRDEAEEDPKELEAAKYELNYIALDGTIGCMVNGAGLAMATMDIIKLYGAVAGQLPRCRRRRDQGARHRGVQDHPVGPATSRASWSTSSAASCAAT